MELELVVDEEEEEEEKDDLMGQAKCLVPGSVGAGLFTAERRDER